MLINARKTMPGKAIVISEAAISTRNRVDERNRELHRIPAPASTPKENEGSKCIQSKRLVACARRRRPNKLDATNPTSFMLRTARSFAALQIMSTTTISERPRADTQPQKVSHANKPWRVRVGTIPGGE